MNDRFKFRYWHTKENKYIYTRCDCLAIKNTILYSLIGKPNKNGWFETDIEKAYNNFELIPEQCTGLKDKNGNLIYEGDIVKDEFGRKFKVIWSEEDCMFDGRTVYYDPEFGNRFDLYQGATDDTEIIGNIHEQKDVK